MNRDLPPLAPLAPDADASSIRQGDRRFAARYLAMQMFEAGLTGQRLRALAGAMSIKVEKEMGEACTERYARKLRALPDVDPHDAMRFAGQRSLTRDERKTLHRILRHHGVVPGAREAVAVALRLTNDTGWRDQVTLHETGMFKPREYASAIGTAADDIVTAALHDTSLTARFEGRSRHDEPHVAASAVLAEVLAEQTGHALVAADRGSNARAIARDVFITTETAQRWARRPDWEPLVRAKVNRIYLARRAVLNGPAPVVRLWRAERTR